MNDFELRAGTEADHRLIYSATAKSLRSSPFYADLPPHQYTQVMNGIVTRMLQHPGKPRSPTPKDSQTRSPASSSIGRPKPTSPSSASPT